MEVLVEDLVEDLVEGLIGCDTVLPPLDHL